MAVINKIIPFFAIKYFIFNIKELNWWIDSLDQIDEIVFFWANKIIFLFFYILITNYLYAS